MKRFPKISVKRSINNRIEQTIGVPQPQEQRRQRLQSVSGLEERPHQRQHEERQPTERESRHYDAQRGAGLALLRQLEAQLLLMTSG